MNRPPLDQSLRILAIMLVLGGVVYGVAATTRAVLNIGGLDALSFDGEWIGIDWVSQGAAVSAVGLLLLLFAGQPGATKNRHLMAIFIALYWCSFGVIHTFFKISGARMESTLVRDVIRTYFIPIREAQHLVGTFLLITSAHRLFWYLPTLGMLFGFAATILAGWLVASAARCRVFQRRKAG